MIDITIFNLNKCLFLILKKFYIKNSLPSKKFKNLIKKEVVTVVTTKNINYSNCLTKSVSSTLIFLTIITAITIKTIATIKFCTQSLVNAALYGIL